MTEGNPIRRHVWISGRVQGVGFRASTMDEVARYGEVTGWVRNLPDGRVEAVFQGSEKEVLALIAWCRIGPKSASVSGLEVREETVEVQGGAEPGFVFR